MKTLDSLRSNGTIFPSQLSWCLWQWLHHHLALKEVRKWKRRWNLICTSSELLRSIDLCRNTLHLLAFWFYCYIANLRREWKVKRSKGSLNKENHDGPSRYCGALYFPCPKESDLGLMPLESFPPQPSNQESQKDKANWSKFPHPPGPPLHLPLCPLSSSHQLQIRTSQSVDLPFKRCQNSLSKLSLHFFSGTAISSLTLLATLLEESENCGRTIWTWENSPWTYL